MTKITKVSKKAVSIILVMLMAFSCMGVTAFAEVEPIAPAAPASITVNGKIGTAVSIDAIEGAEYAIVENTEGALPPESEDYGTSTIFDGLKADTEYKIYARIAANGDTPCSDAAELVVKTYAADPEIVISADDIVADHYEKIITCAAAEKYVYENGDSATYDVSYVIVGSDKKPLPLEGGAVAFVNLTPGTTYKIAGCITIGGMKFICDEKAVDCAIKSEQNAPVTPVPVKVTDSSIEIQKIDNEAVYAIVKKGSEDAFVYGKETKFENLEAGATYVIRAKYDETETALESTASFIEITTKSASKGQAPAPVLLDKNDTTIKVGAGEGAAYKCEFSLDNGATWDDDGLFTGLQPNTKYTFVARYVYNDATEAASVVSGPISIFTNTRVNYEASLNNCKFTIPADEINAKESFTVTATGDMYPQTAQYGDTRYVAYQISYGEVTATRENTSNSLSATLIAPDSAQNIKVTVVYKLQKCVFVDDSGNSSWIFVTDDSGKEIEKVQQYDVHVAEEYNAVKAFFIGILNFLLNTLPSLILSLFK